MCVALYSARKNASGLGRYYNTLWDAPVAAAAYKRPRPKWQARIPIAYDTCVSIGSVRPDFISLCLSISTVVLAYETQRTLCT